MREFYTNSTLVYIRALSFKDFGSFKCSWNHFSVSTKCDDIYDHDKNKH